MINVVYGFLETRVAQLTPLAPCTTALRCFVFVFVLVWLGRELGGQSMFVFLCWFLSSA
jgi:hypothetical protein